MTNILVAHHSETNRTAALAALLCSAAAAQPGTAVRCLPVSDVSCDDLKWMHGVALGSPVYWGTVSGQMKLFLDRVQQRCFGWPVTALRWRAGAAFATGAHEASGKTQAPTFTALIAIHDHSNLPPRQIPHRKAALSGLPTHGAGAGDPGAAHLLPLSADGAGRQRGEQRVPPRRVRDKPQRERAGTRVHAGRGGRRA